MSRCPARAAHPCGRGGESGAALVEFALVLPIFALMLFAMVQFGLIFAGWAQLRSSAQSAARLVAMGDTGCPGSSPCALQAPCSDVAGYGVSVDLYTLDMVCEVQDEVGTPVGATGQPEVAFYLPGDGTVKVCVQVVAQSVTGFFAPVDLSADAQLYLEPPGAHHRHTDQGDGGGADLVLQGYNPYSPPLAGCSGT
jgi:hypothetical protein